MNWIIILLSILPSEQALTSYEIKLSARSPQSDLGQGIMIENSILEPRISLLPLFSSKDLSILYVVDGGLVEVWGVAYQSFRIPGLAIGNHEVYAKLIIPTGNVVATSNRISVKLIGRCSMLDAPNPKEIRMRTSIVVKVGGRSRQVDLNAYLNESMAQVVDRVLNQHPELAGQYEFLTKHFQEQLIRQNQQHKSILQKVQQCRRRNEPVRLILGAYDTKLSNWISTDVNSLDITQNSDFAQYVAENEVQALIAEHVFEHLQIDQAIRAAWLCWKYLAFGGRLRLAVPDGWRNHSSEAFYQTEIRHGHQVSYNIQSLTKVLKSVGFRVEVLEYHKKNGSSVLNAWDISSGVIKRSSKLDKRGPISIIVDAIKEKHMREAAESEIWPFAIEGQGSERFASLCANQKSDHLLRTALESQGSISLPVPPQYFVLRPHLKMHPSGPIDVLGESTLNVYTDHMLHLNYKMICFSINGQQNECSSLIQSLYILNMNRKEIGPCTITAQAFDSEYNFIGSAGEVTVWFILGISRNPQYRASRAPHVANFRKSVLGEIPCVVTAFTIMSCIYPLSSLKECISEPSARITYEDFMQIFARHPIFVDNISEESKPDPDKSSDSRNMCFFTLVLNGMPFIRHHIREILEFDTRRAENDTFTWEWHIVEGIARGRANHWYPYSNDEIIGFDEDGLSVDGTTQYLDYLAEKFSDNVFIHRPKNTTWIDKIQMVNTVLQNLKSTACILVEIDADELWRATDLLKARSLMLPGTAKRCAYFHCHFFITPDLVTVTPGGYSHNNDQEWLRMWSYEKGMFFLSHAPPLLTTWDHSSAQWVALQGDRCFSHEQTERLGLVFTHYAYVFPNQVAFKEKFYGYEGALAEWNNLVIATHSRSVELPVELSRYLSWIPHGTFADRPLRRAVARNATVIPIPSHQGTFDTTIMIDTVTFQPDISERKGIWRVWRGIFPHLLHMLYTYSHKSILVVILVRSASLISPLEVVDLFPSTIHGMVLMRRIPLYDLSDIDRDETMLNTLAIQYRASVFLSTLYTSVSVCPSVLLVHDLIPEELGWHEPGSPATQGIWKARVRAIKYATRFVTVSETTRQDLQRFYPHIKSTAIQASFNGLSYVFRPRSKSDIKDFRLRYGIYQDYIVCVGNRLGYKQIHALYFALQTMQQRLRPLLVLVGPQVNTNELQLMRGFEWIELDQISDEALASCYSGAVALIYLSIYEGFGLPVAEALSCGCPVILSRGVPAVFEVANDAGLYVDTSNATDISAAILKLLNDNEWVIAKQSAEERGKEIRVEWNFLANHIVQSILKLIIP